MCEKVLSRHTVEHMTEEEQRKLSEAGFKFSLPMVRLQPEGWVLPAIMANKYIDKVYNFKVRQIYWCKCKAVGRNVRGCSDILLVLHTCGVHMC